MLRVFIDGGSDASYIRKSVTEEMGLDIIGYGSFACVGFQEKIEELRRYDRVRVSLGSRYGGKLTDFELWSSDRLCAPATPTTPPADLPEGLQLADDFGGGQIDILIGTDQFYKAYLEDFTILTDGLRAWETIFGYVLHGSDNSFSSQPQPHVYHCRQVKEMWSLDSIGIGAETKELAKVSPEPSWNEEELTPSLSEVKVTSLILVGIALAVVLLLTTLGFLVSLGLFGEVDVRADAPPFCELTGCYRFNRSHYRSCGHLFNEKHSIAPELKPIDNYYDDPEKVNQYKLRYAVGTILSDGVAPEHAGVRERPRDQRSRSRPRGGPKGIVASLMSAGAPPWAGWKTARSLHHHRRSEDSSAPEQAVSPGGRYGFSVARLKRGGLGDRSDPPLTPFKRIRLSPYKTGVIPWWGAHGGEHTVGSTADLAIGPVVISLCVTVGFVCVLSLRFVSGRSPLFVSCYTQCTLMTAFSLCPRAVNMSDQAFRSRGGRVVRPTGGPPVWGGRRRRRGVGRDRGEIPRGSPRPIPLAVAAGHLHLLLGNETDYRSGFTAANKSDDQTQQQDLDRTQPGETWCSLRKGPCV